MNMLLLLYISSFLLLLSHCHQIQEEKFTIWQGYQFNNTVILDLPLVGRNMIDCAFKCLRSQPCKAVSYNDLSKTCDFHGTEHSTLVITNVTDENQYLVIPKADDCYLTTSSEYSGTISYTVNGIPCQYWNTNFPLTYYPINNPLDTTAYDTNYCRESTNAEGGPGDACGVDERLPVAPTETKYHFLPSKFLGMVFTCDTLTPGTSVDHCPVSQCGSDDQWTTDYSVSCTGTFDI
ncbi:unnamed protein product [Mytilus edulis]|uniref:Apple domain-containing protein n=1 Tax=Mytilus edulis TaxID=6550 RepID=A0A8S3SU96_MYTED|nr:unnamed protein product [Mytilus edulis]